MQPQFRASPLVIEQGERRDWTVMMMVRNRCKSTGAAELMSWKPFLRWICLLVSMPFLFSLHQISLHMHTDFLMRYIVNNGSAHGFVSNGDGDETFYNVEQSQLYKISVEWTNPGIHWKSRIGVKNSVKYIFVYKFLSIKLNYHYHFYFYFWDVVRGCEKMMKIFRPFIGRWNRATSVLQL